jgi:hypothetical protein
VPPATVAASRVRFDTVQKGGKVGGQEAWAFYASCGLPTATLSAVWKLADVLYSFLKTGCSTRGVLLDTTPLCDVTSTVTGFMVTMFHSRSSIGIHTDTTEGRW